MPLTLKEDMTIICDEYQVNEADLMRRAVAAFVQDLNSKPEQGKYLFV